MNDRYLDALLNRIEIQRGSRLYIKYEKLWNTLYSTVYKKQDPLDKNRISDALNLRDALLNELKLTHEEADRYMCRSISWLEVLIALSIRIDNEYIGDPKYPNPGEFFLELIELWDLCQEDNKHFNKAKVNYIVKNFTPFEFFAKKNGDFHEINGSELWSQCMYYLNRR